MGSGEQAEQSRNAEKTSGSSSQMLHMGLNGGVLLETLITQAVLDLKLTPVPRTTEIYTLTTLHYASPTSDILWFLNIMRDWCNELPKGTSEDWCHKHAVSERNLWRVENVVQELYSSLQNNSYFVLPKLKFHRNIELSSSSLKQILISCHSEGLCVYRGHKQLGYNCLFTGEKLMVSGGTVLHSLFQKPTFVVCLQSQGGDIVCSIVVSEEEANKILKERLLCEAKEVTAQHQVAPITFSNVGTHVRKFLKEYWENFSLKDNLTQVCEGNDLVLECDDVAGTVIVYALERYAAEIRTTIEKYIADIRAYITTEAIAVSLPVSRGLLKCVLGGGFQILEVLQNGETRILAIKVLQQELDFSHPDILNLFTGFHLESIQPASCCEKQRGISAFAVFRSSCDAYTAFQNIATVLFLLEPYMAQPDFLLSVPVEVSQRIPCHIADILLPEIQKPSKPRVCKVKNKKSKGKKGKSNNSEPSKPKEQPECATAIKKVHNRMYRKLRSSCPDKFSLDIKLDKTGTKFLLSCSVVFDDVRSTEKGIDCLMGEQILDQVIIPVTDQEMMQTFTIKLSTPVYRVCKDMIIQKIENLKSKYNLSYTEYHENHCFQITTGCHYKINEVMEKFGGMLAPLVKNLTPEQKKFRQSSYGKLFCERLELVAMCHFDYDENGHISIYGSKAAKAKGWEEFCCGFNQRTCDINKSVFLIDCTRDMIVEFTPLLHNKLCDAHINEKIKYINWCPSKGHLAIQLHDDFEGCKDIFGMHVEADNGFLLETLGIISRLQVDEQCNGECVSCFMEPGIDDRYITEGCGHLYCMECLKMQLRVAVKNNQFPVLCAGNNEPFSYKDYINLIQNGHFKSKAILKSSLRMFMSQHTATHKWCPQVNCTGILKVVRKSSSSICYACHKRACSKCFLAYHPEMTCKEHQSSERMIKEWMERDTTLRKVCPKCDMGIQKDGGCNNVTCTQCKSSICWVCLAYFSSHLPCYNHLREKHGNMW